MRTGFILSGIVIITGTVLSGLCRSSFCPFITGSLVWFMYCSEYRKLKLEPPAELSGVLFVSTYKS